MRMKLLRESVTREPPEPQFGGEPLTDEGFYGGGIAEWTPDE